LEKIRRIVGVALQRIGLLALLIGPLAAADDDAPPVATTTGPLDRFDSTRTLGRRLAVYEPIYFIAGGESPEAKFQLSFKYRLAAWGNPPEGNPSHSIQFAYTQRSLWDIGSQSSPFYDTSYMPELMYQWITSKEPASGKLAWLGLQSGVRHESNGQAEPSSRSLNEAYLRLLLTMGRLDGWHLVLVPEIHDYIGDLDDNPDLERYRGNFELRAAIAHADRESLLLTLIPGKDSSKGSRQLDLTLPIRIPAIGFGTYLMIQYFDGYGESLLSYNERSSSLRIGFALVR